MLNTSYNLFSFVVFGVIDYSRSRSEALSRGNKSGCASFRTLFLKSGKTGNIKFKQDCRPTAHSVMCYSVLIAHRCISPRISHISKH